MFICEEDILYGTGDYEDEPEVQEDHEQECYTVYFSHLLDDRKICASAGQYISFANAVEVIESSRQFKNWLF